MEIKELFEKQGAKRQALKLSTVKGRLAKVKKMEKYISDPDNIEKVQRAIYADFKKPPTEVLLSELGVLHAQISYIKTNLSYWMMDKPVDTPLLLTGTSSHIKYEPKGRVLILAPWNYPFNLSLIPALYAMAAGNTVILKPSELTPNTSALIQEMITELYDEEEFVVVQGDAKVAQSLLELPFDHIFFTGSPQIGKLVMSAAAKHLTSVTLELGGKSPAIVDENVNLKDAAEKLIWAKCLNSGQTCIAPDYAIVHEKNRTELVNKMKGLIQEYYNGQGNGIESSKDYARIVNARHLNRIDALIKDAVSKGASLECGGVVNKEDNFMEPTILTGVTEEMHIMEEEIFGPVLPVLSFKEKEEVVAIINKRPKPLSMYIASNSSKNINYYIENTSSGGTVINDYMLGYSNPNLPFGGVNNGGIGKSLGYHSFVGFSNERGVLRRSFMRLKPFMYPPYSKWVQRIVKLIYKYM